MTELEERIAALLVHETGIKPERVHLATRLTQDIGMDGDDAVEFFEKFAKEFHVDVTALSDHWEQHFLPEGGFPSLGYMVAVGIAVIAGGLLHKMVKWIPMWASMIAALAVSIWVYARFFTKGHPDWQVPITVQDLVDAATSGKWGKHYAAREVSRFLTLE
jgi:hypothetical protein